MKITDIKQQVKRKNRYSIFVDGKYSFALSEGKLLSKTVKIGQELNKNELASLKDTAVIDKGIYRIIELISRRSRSRWEIENYLKRKKYEPEEIIKIVNVIDEKGYINDEDFAKRWVENRRLSKPISIRKLRLELKQKRIDKEVIQRVLDNDDTDEKTVLKELIEKKSRQMRYKDKQKLISYLMRQGFSYGDIKAALNGPEQ